MRLSAVEQAELVRSGEISARELVEASLRRIECANPTVNAFVALCAERALAEADAIGAGDPRALCGVPLGLKDLLSATAGVPTSEGSRAFGDWIAGHDAAHVRRLRESGAIVVGKTNTPELGLRPVTENERFGPTRNPSSATLSAGGSSGGSAAAVASEMVALADGSDLGGSLRIPASCCGVIALKPTRGRVSMGPDYGDWGGGIPVDGVLTRTALDTATALDAISGYEPGDRHYLAPPQTPFTDAVRWRPDRVSIRVARVAPLGVPVDEEPAAATDRAAGALAELGHEVDEWTPDWDDECSRPAGRPSAPARFSTWCGCWSARTGGPWSPMSSNRQREAGRSTRPPCRSWITSKPPSTCGRLLAG
jgi:amidase